MGAVAYPRLRQQARPPRREWLLAWLSGLLPSQRIAARKIRFRQPARALCCRALRPASVLAQRGLLLDRHVSLRRASNLPRFLASAVEKHDQEGRRDRHGRPGQPPPTRPLRPQRSARLTGSRAASSASALSCLPLIALSWTPAKVSRRLVARQPPQAGSHRQQIVSQLTQLGRVAEPLFNLGAPLGAARRRGRR